MKPCAWGILGGTFDPPHIGHLLMAIEALEQRDLECVLLIVAASPPHKQGRAYSPVHQRVDMVRLALINADSRFRLSELELERPGPSYTIDTLLALRGRFPIVERWDLLLGEDSWREFSCWKSPERLLELADPVVFTRPGPDRVTPLPPLPEGRGAVLNWVGCEFSATDLRRRVRTGLSIRWRVPDAVMAYIHEQGLYR